MEPTIKSGKETGAVGNINFQKPVVTLLSPSGGTAISQGMGKLGAPILGSAVSLRGKVPLKPGRSLIDWMKLGKSGKDLTGTNGKVLQVTSKELAMHNKEDDAWMVLNGKVYNVTPYMEFHPGGIPELMRGAGIDGTHLFNEVHKWVNYESMLAKCLVGKYVPSISSTPVHTDRKKSVDSLKLVSNANNRQLPRYSWSQTETTVTISIYLENEAVEKENVIIDKTKNSFHLRLLTDDHVYHIEQDFIDSVGDFEVVTENSVGKVDVVLPKETPGKQWPTLGRDGTQNNLWNKYSDEDITYRPCTVNSISSVTHDTNLYCIEYPHGVHMIVPVGRHVFVCIQSTVLTIQERDQNDSPKELKFSGKEGSTRTKIILHKLMECSRIFIDFQVPLKDGPVCREYTVVPPSLMSEKADKRVSMGRVLYLMIKAYAGGLLTPAISRLKLGDKVDVSVTYAGNFNLSRLNGITRLIMYAAGTGFTPMAGLLQHCVTHLEALSLSQIQLVFFNKQETDILWKEELDQLCSNHDRFTVAYCLSQPDPQWTGLTGHVSTELMECVSPKPENASGILFCVCGPVQFTQKVVRFASELGYTDDMIFAFTG